MMMMMMMMKEEEGEEKQSTQHDMSFYDVLSWRFLITTDSQKGR